MVGSRKAAGKTGENPTMLSASSSHVSHCYAAWMMQANLDSELIPNRSAEFVEIPYGNDSEKIFTFRSEAYRTLIDNSADPYLPSKLSFMHCSQARV